jgi:hypothetical protein
MTLVGDPDHWPRLTEMGVEIPPDEEVHRKIAVNDECPANLFPRAYVSDVLCTGYAQAHPYCLALPPFPLTRCQLVR